MGIYSQQYSNRDFNIFQAKVRLSMWLFDAVKTLVSIKHMRLMLAQKHIALYSYFSVERGYSDIGSIAQ